MKLLQKSQIEFTDTFPYMQTENIEKKKMQEDVFYGKKYKEKKIQEKKKNVDNLT